MTVVDFTLSVRYTLQDEAKNRWSDAELLDYINEGLRDIALRTYFNRVEENISVVPTTTVYTTSKTPISIFKISTYQSYTITGQNEITFDDPREEDVKVTYYAYPDIVTTDINEDIDIIDALKYFVLNRAYEKEDSPENFQKAVYFHNKYMSYINENMTRWHGSVEIHLDKKDYFN